MSLIDKWREKRREGKKRREEHGQIGAIKKALAEGKNDLQEDLDESGVKDTYEEGKEVGERKFEDNPVSINCRKCGSELETANVSRCPHCGYDPGEHKKWFWIHVLLSGVLAATLVGIILIPFTILKARSHRKKSKQGVAEKRWS
jgi:ribosomal protein L37E